MFILSADHDAVFDADRRMRQPSGYSFRIVSIGVLLRMASWRDRDYVNEVSCLTWKRLS